MSVIATPKVEISGTLGDFYVKASISNGKLENSIHIARSDGTSSIVARSVDSLQELYSLIGESLSAIKAETR